jgi:ribonuclease R
MGHKDAKKKKKKQAPTTTGGMKGKLEITRSGMGYVVMEVEGKDVLIRPGDLNTALHGDIVKVKVTSTNPRTGKMSGVIADVVTRKQMEFIGTIQVQKNFAFFTADGERPMPDVYVSPHKLNGAADGDKVVVRIMEWEKNKKPVGEVLEVMSAEDVNDAAMKEILLEHGFSLNFSDAVMEEAARLSDVIAKSEIKKRKDCREILTFTIDPIDAKDFDDAISIRTLKNGNYEIGVHIADVSHYVTPDTELDKEAYERATSVYLPDRVLPMLPEHISNERCSLRPHEDKLTFSAMFQITPAGEIKQHWIGKTVIHSDHRFTYEEVQEIIETKDGLYKEEVLLLNTIAQQYRSERFQKGAINFSSQEVRFKLDATGKPIGIVIKESKEAHQLIEEFMLLANRRVAEYVGKIKVNKAAVPFPYRIHDTPSEEKLMPFVEFAKRFGHVFDTHSPKGISDSFNKMLQAAHGRPEQHVLEQLGIRTMAKAIYTAENIGHYGLGFEHYCHFTSPIRRYPDVLVHRIVAQCLAEEITPDKKMEEKCKHSSERERAAMESERAANKYKQVEYMSNFIGEEFEGVISGVASFGFWVETVEHKCEGLVSITSLAAYDEFRPVEGEYCLLGLRSGRKFAMGDKVWIKVISANLGRRQLDYEWVIASGLKENMIVQETKPAKEEKPVKEKIKEKTKAKEKKKK